MASDSRCNSLPFGTVCRALGTNGARRGTRLGCSVEVNRGQTKIGVGAHRRQRCQKRADARPAAVVWCVYDGGGEEEEEEEVLE